MVYDFIHRVVRLISTFFTLYYMFEIIRLKSSQITVKDFPTVFLHENKELDHEFDNLTQRKKFCFIFHLKKRTRKQSSILCLFYIE